MTLILTIASVGYSQDSASSSPDDARARRAELVSRCEAAADEVESSRKVIDALRREIDAKDKVLGLALAKGDLDESQIAAQKSEIDHLRRSLERETAAYETAKKALDAYKKELAKVTKKKNFFKTMTKVLAVTTLVAAGAVGVLLVKP